MKLLFAFLLLFGLSLTTSAQSRQQQKVDSVFALVKKYFNQKNADAIYNMAGDEFQKELSINSFNEVAAKNLFPLGEIKESLLINFVNNSTATYKLKLSSVTLQLLMNLDKRDKLQLFLFQPFTEPVGNKTALVPSSNLLRSETDKKIDTVARQYIQKANTVGLCIGVVDNGKISTYAYGTTIKDVAKLPNSDTFFELGSITKTFTATLLAYYVNEGKVKLTDQITKYLPDSVAANPELKLITLQQLSNHTSGLARMPDNLVNHAADPLNPYKDYTKQLLYTYLKNCKLESKPGDQYGYSNLGVGLLGSILETVSGQPFNRMITDIICKPLGMLSTNQFVNPLLAPRFAQVYNTNGTATPAWDFDVLAPCGALKSTLKDMLIYAKANLNAGNDQLHKAIALTHQVTFGKDVKIGLGWHVVVVNGISYYFHDGGTYGSSSFLAFNLEKNLAIIVLSNSAENTNSVGVEILKKIQ